MRKFFLEIIVFICGAVVMILELVGSRILAPYLGNSLFVWTSLIGIILGSLSLGYWWGGKLADKQPSYKIFSLIIFLAAIFTGLIVLIQLPVLSAIYKYFAIRSGSILASLILFAPASMLLGMVSPYAVKLKMHDLKMSGKTVGNLYAISTIGSIVGTFLAGFYLISFFGSVKIIVILAAVLFLTSFLAYSQGLIKFRSLMILFFLFFLCLYFWVSQLWSKQIIDLDSQYYRILIYPSRDQNTGRPILNLATDPQAVQSAMFLDRDNDLVHQYTKYYRLAEHFFPNFKTALMVGGGAYSFPKDFLKRCRDCQLAVIEIDPKLTWLAEKYFNLKKNPRLTIYHQDGRRFINQAERQYDIIYLDAFKSYSIPHHLTTLEFVQKLYQSLTDRGLVLLNLISSLEGPKNKLLVAEYKTYRSVFPQVYIFSLKPTEQSQAVQNIILLALKSNQSPDWNSNNPEFNDYLAHLWTKPISDEQPILTDDYAPVDQYMMELLN